MTMKTYSTLILLLISSSGLWAQTVDELNHSLENTYYMHQGKVEMVDEMLADGKISADSAASWHASLLEEFKNSLLQITMRASEGLWAETVDVDEPEVEDTAAAYAAVREANKNYADGLVDGDSKLKFGKRGKKGKLQKRQFTGTSWNIGLAPTLSMLDVDQNFVDSDWLPETGGVYTIAYDIFYRQKRLGRSPLWVRSGLAWDFYGIQFGPQSYLVTDLNPAATNGGVYIMEDPSMTFRTSSLGVNYVTVPLWLYYNGSRSGKKGLSLAMGGYAGLRLGKPTRTLQYTDANNGWTREQVSSRFYSNPFSAGLQARIGFKFFHVTARQSVTPLFNPRLDIVAPEVYVRSLAIGWDFN
ncbi:MAG: PorT family protein [Flavobacteriia bacterium]|jgi:polyhydroxyalkanoate synthesis regulator phasin|nr:PorT family protein [Flavobacteriia bacterium]NDD79910.1 PorT family protein [Flavobacteriia bacterium]